MTVRKTVAFSKNSSNLFFHILTKCNLRCRHCYINPEQHGETNVPLKTIKTWLDAFSHDSPTANVIFLGGEPTLHPDLHHAIKYARHQGFRSITVDTNGYLFHDILSSVSPRAVDFFRLKIVPPLAQKIARQGLTVSYPKVYLDPEEKFECAGLVARNYFIFPNGRIYRCPLCEDLPIHSLEFKDNQPVKTAKLNESDLFELNIPEGCVMNRLIQPDNLNYTVGGVPEYKIACCLLKEEISG